MRVAVHHPARTEPDGTEVPASLSAFRLGRIDDLVNPMTGEITPKQQVAAVLYEEALKEFPDCGVVIEYLVNNGDGTSSWRSEPPADGEESPSGSVVAEHELGVQQTQSATGGAA